MVVSLVSAAGCTSVAESSPTLPTADVPAVEAAAAPTTSAGPAAAASIPAVPTSRVSQWRGAGADDGQEVRVTAQRPASSSAPREDRPVGEYGQPEWTTARRFATVRSYVLADGQIEFEQWLKMHAPRGGRPDHLWQSEISFGLGGRWQLDLYENYSDYHDPKRIQAKHDGVQVETRHALGDWGEIPWNPTLYLEYVANHRAPDKVEGKLLLADDLCAGVHAGLNLFAEQQLSDTRATELGFSAGVSHALIDGKFDVGAEMKYEHVTQAGARRWDQAVNEFLVGPSFQWRPTENTHLDFVPLCGLTKSDRRDPRYEVYLVFGWDFGPEHAAAPISARSK